MRKNAIQRGFTLIEVVMVIVIIGVLAAISGRFITGPMLMFADQARRSALTDAASLSLSRMSREIRSALPNSVRVTGGGTALELLAVVDGQRYRSDPATGTTAKELLDFSAPDTQFNVFGPLGTASSYVSHRLSIYSLGQTGSNPYVDAVLSPAMNITLTNNAVPGPDLQYNVTMSVAHQFPFNSPGQHVYLVRGPVSYICAGGVLTRYENYTLNSTQPATGAATGVGGATVTNKVESCNFTYQGAGVSRGLASLVLVLNANNERVRLMRQVHVDNTP